jgi:hypothetical protein
MGITFPGEILAEQHRHISMCDEDQQYQSYDHCAASQSAAADMEKIRLGMEILRDLDKMHWFRSVIDITSKTCPGWFMVPSLTDSLCIAIENLYDSAVRNSSDTQSSLLTLSRKLFNNAARKVQINTKITLTEY